MPNDVMPARDRGLAFAIIGGILTTLGVVQVAVAIVVTEFTFFRVVSSLVGLLLGLTFLILGLRLRRVG